MGTHSEAQLDTKFVDFMKQLNLYLNHFPKFEKYGLCQQIRNCAYSVYGYVIEAQKRFQKKTSLTNLDIAHEQLRMFLRLAHEQVHVAQFWRSLGIFPLLSLFIPSLRLKFEVEAYRKQLEFNPGAALAFASLNRGITDDD